MNEFWAWGANKGRSQLRGGQCHWYTRRGQKPKILAQNCVKNEENKKQYGRRRQWSLREGDRELKVRPIPRLSLKTASEATNQGTSGRFVVREGGGQWSEDKGKKETFWSALWNSGTGQSFS